MQTKIMNHVKTLSVLLFLGTTLLFVSCDRDNDNSPEDQNVTTEDAVDVLSGALAEGSSGLVAEIEAGAKAADEATQKNLTNLDCGETRDSSTVYSVDRTNLSADYTIGWTWTLLCNAQDIPSALNFTRSLQGTYETQRMESDDTADATLTIEQLLVGPNYVFNGGYERDGSQQSKVREMRAFNSNITINVDDLNVDKGTRRITSGLASFSISGSSSGGTGFEFEGDIVFNGDGSATIIIDGQQYTIDLY